MKQSTLKWLSWCETANFYLHYFPFKRQCLTVPLVALGHLLVQNTRSLRKSGILIIAHLLDPPCLNNITFQLHVPTSGITTQAHFDSPQVLTQQHISLNLLCLPVKIIPSVSGLAILCRRHPDAKVNLHKVLAGICQSLVSFFKRNWSGGTIIIIFP